MTRHLLVLAPLALTACGYAQEDFEADFITALCDKYAECEMFNSTFTEDECRAGAADTGLGPTPTCATFDKGEAKDCITAWQEMKCPDVAAGETFTNPDACILVCSAEE